MIYFKTKKNDVFAYETWTEYEEFGSKDMVVMNDVEVKEHLRKSNNVAQEDVTTLERVWRDGELKRADIELLKVQDSDPKATGTVGDWREYRKALRGWPEHQDFPNKEFRPKAPDAE